MGFSYAFWQTYVFLVGPRCEEFSADCTCCSRCWPCRREGCGRSPDRPVSLRPITDIGRAAFYRLGFIIDSLIRYQAGTSNMREQTVLVRWAMWLRCNFKNWKADKQTVKLYVQVLVSNGMTYAFFFKETYLLYTGCPF